MNKFNSIKNYILGALIVLIVSACGGTCGNKGQTAVAILTATPTSFSLSESNPFQIITLNNTGTAPQDMATWQQP